MLAPRPVPVAALLLLLAAGIPATTPAALADEGRTAPASDEDAKALAGRLKGGAPEDRAAAALEAVENPHPVLLSPLLRLLSDPEQGVREAATKALAARQGKDRKKAAAGLNPRLARLSRRPQHQDELLVVIAALDRLAQVSSVKPLIDGKTVVHLGKVGHRRKVELLKGAAALVYWVDINRE